MKKVISILAVVALLLFVSGMAMADDAEFRLVVSQNDATVGGEFHLDLQMRITEGVSPRTLNSLTVDVYYGSELTQWATNPAANWVYDAGYVKSVNRLGGYYRILTTGSGVNGEEIETPGGGLPAGWDVTTEWQTIVTLRWTINALGAVNISISDATDAAAYFNNHTNAPQGNVTNWVVANEDLGDVSVPVELSSFTVDATGSSVTLNWRTETETENFGFHVYRGLTEQGDYAQINKEIIRGAGNSVQVQNYSYEDLNAQPGNTYYYKLVDVNLNGNKAFHGPISVTVATVKPTAYVLEQSYPNPFNPETAIKFSIKEAGKVSLKIYNMQGQLIRSLVDADKSAGSYSMMWNGTNDQGVRVTSGTYLYTLKVNGFETTKKLVFMK